jgi:hypothetical protein
MKKFVGAMIVVVVWAYLPVAMLALTEPDAHVRRFMPVIPGWLVWFVVPKNEESQYWAASAATVGLILGLSWFGSKGRLPRMAAGFLAFLNSFVCVAIYIVFSAVMAAGGGVG